MTHFWRTLFAVHLAACIACASWYLTGSGALGSVNPLRALFWLGAPWSAASLYLSEVGGATAAILALAPLANLTLIARRGWRGNRRRSGRDAAHIDHARRLWWLLVVPSFGLLFLYWSHGFLTQQSRVGGLAMAQSITLLNCAGLFMRHPSQQVLTLWALVSMPAVALAGRFIALPAFLPPAAWLGALAVLIALAYWWRGRAIRV